MLRQILLLFALLLASTQSVAESRWISDQFEVMLRTGPSTSNAIQLMLTSGTEVEVLATDPDSGYSQVRTPGGTEGWVLTRYLMAEPSAREQLARLTRQLTDAANEGSSLDQQLAAVRSEYDEATRRIRTLEREKSAIQGQLDDVTRKAANTLAIDNQNQLLQQQLTDAEIRIGILEEENDQLSNASMRTWFMTGAGVLLGGVILGLVLPRMRFQRRSRYDRF